MTADNLPAPIVSAEVDLRGYPYTPIFRARLFGSSFHARSSDAEWRAGVTLWLKSWDQVPAGTLPDDDIDLCRLAELGRDLKAWKKLKQGAMRGWVKCSDGRLHHEVVAEGVLEAWKRFSSASRKGKAGAEKRWGSGNAPAIGNDATAIARAMPGDSNRREEKRREENPPSSPPAENHAPAAALPSEVSEEIGQLPDYRPTSAETRLIALFDEQQGRHFGERKRQFPAADDLVFAKRWLADGLTPELAEHVFGAVFARMVGKSPPRSLKYLDGAVTDALTEQARPAASAMAMATDPDAEHRAQLEEALKRGKWFSAFGPGPWEDSYAARHLLASYPAEQIAALTPGHMSDIPPFLQRKRGAA